MSKSEFLWCEEYRPKTIDDCILPDELKSTFKKIVESGDMHNMLLSGTSGLGKTTVAKALCNELNLDYILINSSEDSGIDVLRNRIRQFASSISLDGSDSYKVVILDEADYLNPQSTQPALRAFIEEFSKNCRFIFTCNFRNKIIEPLQSRCAVIEFNTTKKHLAGLAAQFHKRLSSILNEKKVKYDERILAEFIMLYAPDWRRVINEAQRYSSSGELSASGLVGTSIGQIDALVGFLREKNFKSMRGWVAQNPDLDSSVIFRKLYDNAYEYLEPMSIPQMVLILADYQHKAAFVADKELNIVACLTELMGSLKFK
jgi:DNA polymerase III delta prime subunit